MRKPKESFDRWRNYVTGVNTKGILDQARAQRLNNCLNRIPNRTLKDGFNRVVGDGDKVSGAIRRLLS
eukprot:CAMPEP_0168316314 /NCGR_PEP_ID=MMETSP0210-20121227/15183_1 /TAXON_ID=40633 /ORGANISM="Condylostoma magnum, Strain COL2" /LENGTH=67 /DNA_ID=CAMNT_0008296479 /DNA_START=1 /DNA_END=200 /DNA_ORIENTATION=-